ncbi:MAG: dienelactone hydrolase family protein [Nocardioidaceae bacterium]|nr:dienelactone hydrolase family protein [Nocardioidaceae bacterium]
MAQVALFHSVLGVRTGVLDAASRLRDAGHEVLVVDQYDGRVFDDYDEAAAHTASIGFPALMQAALDAVSDLPDGFVTIGFSNGGGMAEHVALHRGVAGVVMLSGALPLEMLGAETWPAGVDAQVHHAVDDPFHQPASTESVVASVRAAGAEVEVFVYPGAGHLFTDETLPDEHDPEAAELLFERVLDFCARRD